MKKRVVYHAIVYATILLYIVLLIAPSTYASSTPYANWHTVSDSLLLNFKLSTDLEVMPKSEDYTLKNINLSIGFFPRTDYRQDVVSFTADPENYEKGDNLDFVWINPEKKEYTAIVDSNIKTINLPKKVGVKLQFPVNGLTESYAPYLQETDLVNYNNEAIIELATKLAEGEDDLYNVVFKLAEWTNENIEYSLDTVTADASLPASWVLKNRRGVCDELTNLFIAMTRTLGIPAKFVAGISYTESELFTEHWGTHGWAEVYFPNHGWVPFDVTYGQFGIVDPTHIKLKESFDADKTSTTFEWLGNNVDIKSSGLKMDTKVLDYGNKMPNRVEIKAAMIKPEVGFGSYNIVQTTLKNSHNYYLPIRLSISKTEKLGSIEPLKVIDPDTRFVLLKPNQEKSVFWRVKVADELVKQNIYTFPILIYTDFNETSSVSLSSRDGAVKMTESEAKELYEALTQAEEISKSYSKNLEMSCKSDKLEYYIGEKVSIKCSITNKGNINIDELNICIKGDCKKTDLKISQQRDVAFTKEFEANAHDIVVSAKNKDISKTYTVSFVVEEFPKLVIKDIDYPKTAKFSEPAEVKFKVVKDNSADADNVFIRLHYNFGFEQWTIEKLTESREFSITIPAYQLASQENDFKIELIYYDKDNKKYESEENFIIKIEQLSLKERVIMYFNRINSDRKMATIVGGSLGAVILIIAAYKVFPRRHKHKK